MSQFRKGLEKYGFSRVRVAAGFEVFERAEHEGELVHQITIRSGFEPPPNPAVAAAAKKNGKGKKEEEVEPVDPKDE